MMLRAILNSISCRINIHKRHCEFSDCYVARVSEDAWWRDARINGKKNRHHGFPSSGCGGFCTLLVLWGYSIFGSQCVFGRPLGTWWEIRSGETPRTRCQTSNRICDCAQCCQPLVPYRSLRRDIVQRLLLEFHGEECEVHNRSRGGVKIDATTSFGGVRSCL